MISHARGFAFVSTLRVLLLVFVGVASLPAVHAQDARWRAHTSMRQVNDVSAASDGVWAATTGGIFHFDVSTGSTSAFTAGDGLHSVQTQAIAFDPVRQVVWIGYRNGVLDRLNPRTGTVSTFRDIERADRFASREIHRILVRGDSVFVATSFGVVVFDPVRSEVRDTYSQLGSIAPGTPVHDLTIAPGPGGSSALWLATNDGVAVASMQMPNLQDPAAWTVERAGLPGLETRAIAYFDGRIYVGTTGDLAVRGEDGVYAASGLSNSGILDLTSIDDRLVGTERFAPFVVEPGRSARRVRVEGYQDPVRAVLGPDGAVWVGDRQGGLVAIEKPSASDDGARILRDEVYPAGPFDNHFSDLTVDVDGNLWAAGILDPNTGFYRFTPPDQWTNFTRRFVPELAGRSSYERIHVDRRGHAWAGSAGTSLAEVTAGGEVRIHDASNSSLRPASGTSTFIIIGGIHGDPDGNVWVTNRAAPVPLHMYRPGQGWTGIPRVECGNFSTTGRTFDRIFVDSFGQKWIVVLDEANLRRVLGLLVLDVNRTPEDVQDDECVFFSSEGAGGQGLPGVTVTSVVEDRDGIMWIGTDKGLAFMINTGVVARDPTAIPIWPQHADRSFGTFLLSGIRINDLAVDPANRLWVATDEGVSVVRPAQGGYEITAQFTTRNSPLFSNSVMAIAVDPRSGKVYMATDQGLLSYESDAIAASEQVRELKVYPNPVRMVDGAEPSVFIEVLVEETDVRILTLTGDVVARIETRGGRARWDGRDLNGRFVPSGVYLVVAVGRGGEGAAYGRVAVIR